MLTKILCFYAVLKNLIISYVRIDILERLFILIFNSNSKIIDKQKEIKLTPEMLNLLGCNKENFVKLLKI